VPGRRAGADEPPPPLPRRSATRRRIDDELDAAEGEERRERRGAGSGTGMKIGLIVRGVVLVLLVFGCGVTGIVVLVMTLGGGTTQSVSVGLAPNASHDRFFQVNRGQRIQVQATALNPGAPQANLGIVILLNGNMVASNNPGGANPSITFDAQVPGNYVVRVVNRGPNFINARLNTTIR
jgi:hypothetical protein